MAIGLSRLKNLSESNLNLKTALQKLYAPGIENDLELFSLSSSVESICFSGLESSPETQVFRLTSERLKTITGGVIQRTKFNTKYFTFTDGNEVYFSEYGAGVGNSEEAALPHYSQSGSVPAVEVVGGGGGFYFLNSDNSVSALENFTGTWSASSSATITVTLANHGFIEGQGLGLRFNNSGGGVNATFGEYVILTVPTPSSFTVSNSAGSISGSGDVGITSSDIKLSNVGLKGKVSGGSLLKADVVFTKIPFDYFIEGRSAKYTNTSFGLELESTASTTITLVGHGFNAGDSVYIEATSGSLKSGFVGAVRAVVSGGVSNPNTFTVLLPVSSANTDASCVVYSADELTRFTPSRGSRYGVKSVKITDAGRNYVIPESLEIVEGVVNETNTGAVVKINKQQGIFFNGMPEIIKTKIFTYTVKNATNEGFFLYDEEAQKYLFLDKDTPATGLLPTQKITLRRFDGVFINNILQFKFAQSPIYLQSYTGNVFSISESISGAVNSLSISTSELKLRSRLAIQNTKRPTPSTSSENILGYTYNSFAGQDVVIWQRVVLRDQDYVLNPADSTLGANSITGDRLKTSVDGFVMGPIVSWSSTATGLVTMVLSGHSVKTGDPIRVNNISVSTGSGFSDGNYTATYINPSSFSISTGLTTVSTGFLNLIIPDPNFQIKVPGLFIKVGADYRRAFSTTDKPFFQQITDGSGSSAFANPTITGGVGASFTGQALGALSAEGASVTTNPSITNWYSYNTTISELAQRIHPGGTNGAFYFHRPTAPIITTIPVVKNGAASSIYAIPLFTLAS